MGAPRIHGIKQGKPHTDGYVIRRQPDGTWAICRVRLGDDGFREFRVVHGGFASEALAEMEFRGNYSGERSK